MKELRSAGVDACLSPPDGTRRGASPGAVREVSHVGSTTVVIPVDAADGTRARRIGAVARLAWVAIFGVLPAVLTVAALRERGLGWDFHAFYFGARMYLDGRSPYPAHSLAALAGKQGFVYPAPMAALFVPMALLPYTVSLTLWLVGSVAAIAVGLRVLGVRDWRCLGALFLTHPVLESVRLGTLMPFLMLLLALLWRHRDRIAAAAALAAVLVLSKVFLFPLLLWLAATRRARTAALGAAAAAGLCLLGWLPIHFSTFATYPALLHALAVFEQTFSAAAIRVDRPHRQICWRIWTEALPPRRVAIVIESASGVKPPLILRARIERGGQTQGCARIARTSIALARGLADRPGRYRLVVTVPRAAPIVGLLRTS